MTQDADTITISATLVHETDAAVLLDIGAADGKPVWFPKSQVEQDDAGDWEMPEWLARKKGAI